MNSSPLFRVIRSVAVLFSLFFAIVACDDIVQHDLGTPPNGLQFTDENGNPVGSVADGTLVYLRDADGNVVATITVNGDVDLSGLVAGRTDTVAFAHFPDTDGLTGDVTLFVPCKANTNTIYVTPGAITADDVSLDGSGDDVVTLSVSEPGPTDGYTFANAAIRAGDVDCQIVADIADFNTGGAGDNISTPANDACDGECPAHASCIGTGESATCVCDPGYFGDGTSCETVVSCASSGEVTFSHAASSKEADCITADICINRSNNQPIFNSALEFVYHSGDSGKPRSVVFGGPPPGDDEPASPVRTLWAAKTCAEAEVFDFTDFVNALDGNVGDEIEGTPLCLWLPDQDLKYDLIFGEWGDGDEGGTFAYTRTAFGEDGCGHGGATCVAGNDDSVVCNCPEGFINDSDTGKCRLPDPCNPSPCGEGAECRRMGIEGHRCECDGVEFFKEPTVEEAVVFGLPPLPPGDMIDETVYLSRNDSSDELYNAYEESDADDECDSDSPELTEWALVPCNDATTDDFSPFMGENFADCSPNSILGEIGCVHLTASNQYWDIHFTDWCRNEAGDCFGYIRWHAVPDAFACASLPSMELSTNVFEESEEDDGSVPTTATLTLSNDTFTVQDDLLIEGTHYEVSGGIIPSGLNLLITATSATTADITFNGEASAHDNENDVEGLEITFLAGAFTSGTTPVDGSRRFVIGIDFTENVPE